MNQIILRKSDSNNYLVSRGAQPEKFPIYLYSCLYRLRPLNSKTIRHHLMVYIETQSINFDVLTT